MRSLRRALAARFSLTMFFALALIALWAFLGTHRWLKRQLDESLTSSLHLQTAALAAGIPIAFQPGSSDLEVFIEQVNRFVTVRDSAARVITANTPFAGSLPVDLTSFERARAGEITWANQSWANRRIRTLYAPAPAGSHDAMSVIQLAASLEPLAEADRNILFFMVGTVILGTVATLVGAGLLADSAAAPVTEIADQARTISAGTLNQRITAHADVQEFQGLVHVLNGMLGRLERVLETQRRIIADVAHDLRTPITAMTGQLEIALRSERTAEQYHEVLSSCLEEAVHLGSISDALIMLARIEAGELLPERSQIDLTHLADTAIQHVRCTSGDREIRLHAPPDGAVISADSGMLQLVLEQLLNNALQHTPADAAVAVWIEQGRSLTTLAIEDGGPGLPADELPLLFERFYRRDTARGRAGGAGLGMTIAAAIVAAHGGTIQAEEASLGGLRIAIELPRHSA